MADNINRSVVTVSGCKMDRYRLPDLAGMNVVCSGCVASRKNVMSYKT